MQPSGLAIGAQHRAISRITHGGQQVTAHSRRLKLEFGIPRSQHHRWLVLVGCGNSSGRPEPQGGQT